MATDLTTPVPAHPDVAPIQRRTLRLLLTTQIVGGIGVTIGIAVGALLAAEIAGTALAGLALSAAVVGGALLAVPVTRITNGHGRRPGLAFAYGVGTVGGTLIVLAAATRSIPLLFVGMLLFGGGSTANLQARYAAVDLAAPDRRARQLSLIVWATTIGAVAAPNFAALADRATRGWGLPALAGPFAFSAAAFVLAAGVLLLWLRPDPLLTARRLAAARSGDPGPAEAPPLPPGTDPAAPGPVSATGPASAPSPASATGPVSAPSPVVAAAEPVAAPAPPARRGAGMRAAWSVVRARPAARLGIAAVAMGHLVMVAVMTMAPVHLREYYAVEEVLPVVGLVLSLHIAGMYGLAPVVGWLADRSGRRPVILGGIGTLLAACAVTGTAGHHTLQLTVGLILLGLGWSATMVAGSTLLSESVPDPVRPSAQGLSDLVMGLAGALAGAVSGFVMQVAGYPVLSLLAAVAVAPLLALALRRAPVGAPDEKE
ncbi:MFS transporter [Micromonospora sp. WMMD1082]|uniref:MFS transporter n=1 Tax=Micromonospora sp. WMMD1082 TaxID=3016104 RepID=UPI00241704A5|nr:MFS transporter [Micromonospora sp. WMMD1082]MDG4792391.1 MFS transporter [Micromonospora sp. WMMD1082]